MTPDERRQHQERLEALVGPAIAGIATVIGPRPPRNAQSLLAGCLAILNRTGFAAQTEAKLIGDAERPLQSKLVVEFIRAKPAIVEAKVVKELE